MMELLDKKEELCEELQEWLVKDGPMNLPAIKHPLLYSIAHVPQMNAWVNRSLKQRQGQLAEAMVAKDWERVVVLHERPWRVQAFSEVAEKMSDKSYWETLRWVWVDSENIWQNITLWRKLLSAKRQGQFMNKDDLREFRELPETLVVYRGYEKGRNYDGLSYTLDRSRAEWFAERFHKGRGRTRERRMKKSGVFAYTDARSEREIIILN